MKLFDPCHLPASFDPEVSADVRNQYIRYETRRQFFGKMARGLGSAAFAIILGEGLLDTLARADEPKRSPEEWRLPNFAPKAKRAIYLCMAGAPSQLDMWDYKPALAARFNQDLPDSVRGGQLLTGMTAGQARFPLAPSIYKFAQHGKSGTWVSELLPHTAKVVDELAVVKSMWTEAINHDPAITYLLTGNIVAGKPSIGSWLAYGLGRMNDNLPTFVVLTSKYYGNAQALFSRLWGSGFLPASYSGVAFRSDGDPVLYLRDPSGIDRELRRAMLDGVEKLNQMTYEEVGDPETHARIEQYEMAFRMQSSVPDLMDFSNEPAETFELYGPDSKVPGTFAYNCLLARRMAERGVRFTQIFHRGWDQHNNLPKELTEQCKAIDQGSYALITDLKRRGLLDDTLVVWGGEFGRTVYCQGELTTSNYGRDHHPKCFTMWLAGGGVKPGLIYGETDDFGYNIVKNPVHIRDLNATILHTLGIDHEKLTYRFQGLDQKLTGVVPANVVTDLLA
jgi:hypothetical protein